MLVSLPYIVIPMREIGTEEGVGDSIHGGNTSLQYSTLQYDR